MSTEDRTRAGKAKMEAICFHEPNLIECWGERTDAMSNESIGEREESPQDENGWRCGACRVAARYTMYDPDLRLGLASAKIRASREVVWTPEGRLQIPVQLARKSSELKEAK